ncbi:MAG: hypothetical protein BWY06_01543 [Candidatus Latescibacteria bacterium ADurb.Bin168]|nr:MAG: hypothetical protein BWY06_01543 [Candidatus Latescibacteria bacterium ADurb.Bin168]
MVFAVVVVEPGVPQVAVGVGRSEVHRCSLRMLCAACGLVVDGPRAGHLDTRLRRTRCPARSTVIPACQRPCQAARRAAIGLLGTIERTPPCCTPARVSEWPPTAERRLYRGARARTEPNLCLELRNRSRSESGGVPPHSRAPKMRTRTSNRGFHVPARIFITTLCTPSAFPARWRRLAVQGFVFVAASAVSIHSCGTPAEPFGARERPPALFTRSPPAPRPVRQSPPSCAFR